MGEFFTDEEREIIRKGRKRDYDNNYAVNVEDVQPEYYKPDKYFDNIVEGLRIAVGELQRNLERARDAHDSAEARLEFAKLTLRRTERALEALTGDDETVKPNPEYNRG